MATRVAQDTLKLVHNALLINQLWFVLAFLEVLGNSSTDKDGPSLSVEELIELMSVVVRRCAFMASNDRSSF